jgi:hypothetical protein
MKLIAISGLALVITAATASGTPLPDPPFPGGGSVPPSATVFKQELAVDKLLLIDLRHRMTCDAVAVENLQLAYTPVNARKVEAVQQKWQACMDASDRWYAKYRDRQLVKGTPSCLDQAGIDAQQAAQNASIASVSSQIYCDGAAADPDPVTGLNIPEKKRETIGETALAKLAMKIPPKASRCYLKAAVTAFQLGGWIPPNDVARTQTCLDRISRYISATVADLHRTQKLPPCLPPEAAEAAMNEALAFVSSSTAAIYCAE